MLATAPDTSNAAIAARRDTLLVGAVWAALLLAADTPTIAWTVVTDTTPPGWLSLAGAAVLVLMTLGAWASEHWRPIRGFLLALLALVGGGVAAGWLGYLVPQRWDAAMLVRSALQLIPCALLALSLLGSGLQRRDIFIAVGDVRAPSRLARWLPRWSWARLGPALVVILAAGLSVQLVLTVRPDVQHAGRLLSALPWALGFAALNAAQEEFRFRAVLLRRLIPVVGGSQALVATSALFGLAHWFGHPSGPSGVLLAGVAGWIWGRSMLDTGGSGWAWAIHAAQDVVIFLAIAMAKGA
jgi:membrane protease YdiL (CAAX protease family)